MGNINLDAYKLISFDKISSTQDIAKDLIAKNKVSDKTIITAKAQSNGHGRYNRKWISHHGNLYASFIYKQPEPQPTLSYAIAIAVAETLLKYNMNPKIKWPNDILIDGKKISGILIEYFNNFVIIGIGINIQTNPTIKEYKTIKTNVFSDVTTDELLSVLIKQINKWKHTEFEKVRTRW
ncbi:MAG: biotin--[acetyl-CoA-carboxylase] ligase [Alphaproteobacteria bacterium]|nr:biotin--[acetyl-CoA-carboxylase] ligase [Alphaproteobacteria bacterium]